MTENQSPVSAAVSEQNALTIAQSQVASKNYYWLNAELQLYRPTGANVSDAERGLKSGNEIAPGTSAETQGVIAVAPNPFKDAIDVSFISDENADVKIQLFDALGKLVKSLDENNRVTSGIYHYNYSLNDLKPGIYFINVSIKGSNNMKKVCKMD